MEKESCVFCNNSYGDLTLFTEKKLKKSRDILKLRKKHNLKYGDVVLPDKEFQGGYHEECHKLFMSLMESYFIYEPVEKSSAAEDLNSAASPELASSTQPIEPQISSPDPISGPTLRELLQPFVVLERLKLPRGKSIINLPSRKKRPRSNSSRRICMFCDRSQKIYRRETQRLVWMDRDKFLLRVKKVRQHFQELYDKVLNCRNLLIFYHRPCYLNLYQKKERTLLHTRNLQIAFKKIIGFIGKNVVHKQHCYFLSYIHEVYLEFLRRRGRRGPENTSDALTAEDLEDEILELFNGTVQFFSVENDKILTPKKLYAIDDELFKKLKDENYLLLEQFKFYQGNYQDGYQMIDYQTLIKGFNDYD